MLKSLFTETDFRSSSFQNCVIGYWHQVCEQFIFCHSTYPFLVSFHLFPLKKTYSLQLSTLKLPF